MNLTLTRVEFKESGIFGVLEGEKFVAATLEHSYDGKAKIPAGTYTCVRSKHRLQGMSEDFETFEITEVKGHTGLLFHWGNYNGDSEGCVLIGTGRNGDMIVNSRAEFANFMKLQEGLNSFVLSVTD